MGSFSPVTIYLILYNASCCIGWARVLSLALPALSATSVFDGLASVYSQPGLSFMLALVQTAALLEIIHALTRMVRSPVMVTTMQVGSRIAALFAIHNSPESQVQFGAGLMILSWSLVEVPRYAFYLAALISGDATKKTPFPLFWLRYSLFAILYPTGITGELTVFLSASKDPAFLSLLGPSFERLMYWFIMSFPIIYAPGALPMILNMAANRKSAFKKRFAKPPPPPRGLVFPLDDKGGRSSTPVAKSVLAAAVSSVSPARGDKILKERNWRFGYVKHWIGMVEAQCVSTTAALTVAGAGLDRAHSLFEFVAPDGSKKSLKDAMGGASSDTFKTGFIKGEGIRQKSVGVPYKGKMLMGEELKTQVKKWVEYGTIEPSAGAAICKAADNPQWLDDLKDQYFVLLGAGSAMGPFLVLMALGLNVVAIDLDRPQIWKRLIKIAKASSGTFTFPMKVDQSTCPDDDALAAASGCNLFTETPVIRNWLMDLYPGKSFTVGCYAYLNGALHMQVSLAMDAICKDLSEKRKGTSLAYLCTPTDLHLIPKDAHDASLEHWKDFSKRLYCMALNFLSGGKFLRKNAMKPMKGEGGEFYVCNELSVAQGPNYALAKRMQHWRAIIARNNGSIVSSNIAPSTSTKSVVQNKTFAWAYEGMPYFIPYEIFEPDTSNAVMFAILLSDIRDPNSAGNPKTRLDNPNQLFSHGSFNGGAWRCAYEVDSIGEVSVLIYFTRLSGKYVAGLTVVAAVAAKYFGLV